MRAPLVTVFHETVNHCFGLALENILGRAVRNSTFDILARNGISEADISSRFDDVVAAMVQVFGPSSRVIVHRMLVELYREYSQRVDFSYEDSLRNQTVFLREKVVADHLRPKRLESEDSFFDKGKAAPSVESPGTNAKRASWNSFYRLKRGVGSDSS